MIDKQIIDDAFNYLSTIEADLKKTTQFIEPFEQEQTYSFEFRKIIVLSCSELERLFKIFGMDVDNKEYGNIGEYKDCILRFFPQIFDAEITVDRRHSIQIKPFEKWAIQGQKLSFWDAYTTIKHGRINYLKNSTYINAEFSLGAVLIFVLYLYKYYFNYSPVHNGYFSSRYCCPLFTCKNSIELPGFDKEESNE